MPQTSDDTSATEDDVVIPLRPDPRPKDPTGAERQARWRENRQRNGGRKKTRRNSKKRGDGATTVTPDPAFTDAPPIMPAVTPSVDADGVTPSRETSLGRRHVLSIDLAAYAAAVALASAAAWFSIRGMVALFPGSPIPWSEWPLPWSH